ncbi:putative cysteine desulfurase [Thermobispora bispora]|uniref:Cysteine desulfurase n=1 Tax=Thermobispora bispora (strain ATCC 19993 / DSM 43833 / CBS 139.67 / JCM 10125 / KCTC 9307 / NBRC 14880 / R51) TaxID=469371 RepID=D6Y1S4_THEBD|nr:cysteine desulfurase [Thermobispora bispora]MBO2474584.1 cysteine desulfurase [Actinomycetales bacterium]MDI9580379.1 cysteine desulfurase [Thermobispora sp.]ADG88680.1 cysteine desulfurase, SufS subfamily [Thermobispora bispora DSM 43833]MBX6166895.1 cysteine desulfurase [Thermobispora bispora]QSI48461.1 cysteine desulfurase [Thermobispora bispora]
MTTAASFDVERIRKDFPILSRELPGGRPLIYLDSANSSQKPTQVIETMRDHLTWHYGNVGRALHTLGSESTEAYENARDKIARFIGAPSRDEVIFTKNASEALNLIAYSFGNPVCADERFRLGPGDEIVISEMEHHSNIVPWQLLAQRTGATLRWFPVTDEGRLDLSGLGELVNERTKIVSIVHQSNVLGTVNPVAPILARAREVGALMALDASQSVPHQPIDVAELGVDFVAFTGHKMVGPSGIGVLWGRRELLDAMPPFLGGGEMIEAVWMDRSTYAPVPHKFEAGTPPIVEAIGLGAAVDYLESIGMDQIKAHEASLVRYALDALQEVPGLRIIGPRTPEARGGTISFTLEGIHPHDVGQILDDAHGIAVRVGHHCARPLHLRFGIPATTRASFYLYNTTDEIDALVRGLHHVQKVFG